jgi:hypothetical protein
MIATPSFAVLLEGFFTQRLMQQRQASPHTIASYRDTFRMLLQFIQKLLRKAPSTLALEDIDAPLVVAYLDELERLRRSHLLVAEIETASPKANAICERVIGTIRRECLDWMIPISEGHLRSILREWVAHYDGGRPHSALGPGVPGPPAGSARAPKPESRRRWTPGALVQAKSVLGGLHYEYSLSATPAVP